MAEGCRKSALGPDARTRWSKHSGIFPQYTANQQVDSREDAEIEGVMNDQEEDLDFDSEVDEDAPEEVPFLSLFFVRLEWRFFFRG